MPLSLYFQIILYLCESNSTLKNSAMALSIFKLLFGNKADTSQETDHSESSIQEKHNIQSRSQGEENNVFVLNSGKASKITLFGASNSSAETIKRMCDNYSSYYDAVKSIRDVLLENAIQVAEVAAFQSKVQPLVEGRVQKRISEDGEWESLGEKDRRDKMAKYVDESMVSFDKDKVSPALETALSYLAMNSPIQVPLLDEMINEYGMANLNTYCEYSGRKNPVIQIANADYRKPLKDLVNAGLAYSGNDLSVEELLSSLTLNELNSISGPEARFTRKDKALKYISEKDDVASIIEKYVDRRSLFALKPLPPQFNAFDFDGFSKLQSYYEALADVVFSVYNGLSEIEYQD